MFDQCLWGRFPALSFERFKQLGQEVVDRGLQIGLRLAPVNGLLRVGDINARSRKSRPVLPAPRRLLPPQRRTGRVTVTRSGGRSLPGGVLSGRGCDGSQAFQKFQRLEDQLSRAVVPRRLELQHDAAVAPQAQALLRERRAQLACCN